VWEQYPLRQLVHTASDFLVTPLDRYESKTNIGTGEQICRGFSYYRISTVLFWLNSFTMPIVSVVITKSDTL